MLGLAAAACTGVLMPVFTIFLGDLVNALGASIMNPTADITDEVNK